jgi:hypothetical protein
MGANITVLPEEVEFLPDPTGEMNRVRVRVYRDAAHGNPMDTFIARLFGKNTMDISAVATGEASPADLPTRCLPFTIPDRWEERTNPPFNAVTSYFDLYAGRNGNNPGTPLTNPDVYRDVATGSAYTGYSPWADRGTLIKLKASVDTTVSPSVYNPIVVPGTGTGADRYRNGIVSGVCPTAGWGDTLELEPGGMTGPTSQGIDELIAKDPNARWEQGCRCVMRGSERVADSPRIAEIPLYDPYWYETHQQTGRNVAFKVANYLGVFVDGMVGNEVRAYIMPAPGKRSGDTNIPGGMFLKTVRIVQ